MINHIKTAALIASTTVSSMIGGGVARSLWEGRRISFGQPSFNKGMLSGLAFPATFASSFLALNWAKARSSNPQNDHKTFLVLTTIATFVGTNYFPRENWKLKVVSNLGAFSGIVIISAAFSIFFKRTQASG